MSETAETTVEQTEAEMRDCEVCDESLKAAAGVRNSVAYMMGFCTGLSLCPS